jgi:hypothetical protein
LAACPRGAPPVEHCRTMLAQRAHLRLAHPVRVCASTRACAHRLQYNVNVYFCYALTRFDDRFAIVQRQLTCNRHAQRHDGFDAHTIEQNVQLECTRIQRSCARTVLLPPVTRESANICLTRAPSARGCVGQQYRDTRPPICITYMSSVCTGTHAVLSPMRVKRAKATANSSAVIAGRTFIKAQAFTVHRVFASLSICTTGESSTTSSVQSSPPVFGARMPANKLNSHVIV